MNFIDKALSESANGEEAEALIDLVGDTSQEGMDNCYLKLAINNDYDAFWNRVYSYADENIKSSTGI